MILEVSWDSLWTLRVGSHNDMVTALGSCVKWPLSDRKREKSRETAEKAGEPWLWRASPPALTLAAVNSQLPAASAAGEGARGQLQPNKKLLLICQLRGQSMAEQLPF
jgi:hypothetical protein